MLAGARCLSSAGFELTAVATTRTAPGLWSRAPNRRLLAPDPRRSVEGFVARLEEIVRSDRHELLLAGMDASLFAVSLHRDRLEPYVRLGLPSHEIVERVLDREQVALTASRVGLASPRSEPCADADQAAAVAESFGYPVLVKPIHTVVEVGSQASRWASVVAPDPESVRSAARAFGACIVQRQIRGDVLSFGGVATDAGLLGFLVSRYIRTWPAAGGNVSFSEAIAPPPGLVDRVAALVAGLEWQGIFELELIATDSGEFAAIDFNPRVYGSLSLAVASGAPLPAIWCGWLLGRSPAPTGVQAGWRYRWEDADLRDLAWCVRNRRVGRGLAIATPRRKVTHAYFQLRDPVPAIARGVQLVGKAGERARVREHAREASIVPLPSIEDSREEWTALAERSGNIFSTWEWARVWWNHFGAGKRLELSAIRHGERTAAIVPLHAQRWAGVGILRFIGHGPGDQLGPVCDPLDLSTANAGLARIASRSEVLLAERLPREREWADELRGSVLREESSPLIDLVEEGDWESYLRARSQNFRQQVRRRARRLERSLGVTFRLTEDAGQLESDFDTLVKLHAARWGTGSAAFSESRRAFHREFASYALRCGWLRLWLAEADGAPVAAWYGFRFAGVESYYQLGRDPGWDRFAVGAGILEHTIREAFADGMREYRLLRGSEAYKRRYLTRDPGLCTVAAAGGPLGRSAVAVGARLARSATARRLLKPEDV